MGERQGNIIQFKPKKKGVAAGIILLVVLVFLVVFFTGFHIYDIEVTGNKHYSEEQIKDFVMANGYINNTFLLMLKNKVDPIENIPFVAKIEVEYVTAHKISITVYEKAMAGCVEYMNEYVYFDEDGYVLEISSTKLEDSPCITGMYFAAMELHEKLPIDDESRFRTILKLTQLIQKYELQIQGIRFTSDNEIVLEYEDIRVELGKGDNLEEQLVDLRQILEGLSGKKGTLDMKDFDAASGTASFKLDEQKKKTENDSQDVGDEDKDGTGEDGEQGASDGENEGGSQESLDGIGEDSSPESSGETSQEE